MRHREIIPRILTVVSFLLLSLAAPTTSRAETPERQARPPRTSKTVANLNTAIQGEANAAHRYRLFAERADREGYPQVAKLFRAAALAESIHRRNHERVLRNMGLTPRTPVIEPVKVGTTRQNLEVPIKGELNEADEMYPAFVQVAKQEDVPAAAQSFTYALETEAEHAALFEDALSNLGHNPPTDYYVGQVSGDTVTHVPSSPRETYTRVE